MEETNTELFNLEENPMAALMVCQGDKLLYFDEKANVYLEVEVSKRTSLGFGKKSEFTIEILNGNKHHKLGKVLTVGKSQLSLEKELAEKKINDFMRIKFN
jgi:hypothetical protein